MTKFEKLNKHFITIRRKPPTSGGGFTATHTVVRSR